MSLFQAFKRPKGRPPAQAPPRCDHMELAPHWDSLADMGKRDRVLYYTCAACGAHFDPESAPIKA